MTDKPRHRSKVQVKFRVPTATHQALSVIAQVKGVSLPEVINRAVRAYVDDAKGAGGRMTDIRIDLTGEDADDIQLVNEEGLEWTIRLGGLSVTITDTQLLALADAVKRWEAA